MLPACLKKIMCCLASVLLGWATIGRAAAEPEGGTHDILVYKDGDRVQGRLVGREGNLIVFHSDRFGELRVPADKAVVIMAEKPVGPAAVAGAPLVTPAAPAAPGEARPAAHAEAERISLWEYFSPAVLTAGLRNYFGPWHGKLAFSAEVVSDTADRTNLSVETQLKRKWSSDEVQLKGRYDYSETNQLTTTDLIKGDGLWRHEFPRNRFVLYHPSLEWNRASFRAGVPSDYLLLQQEIGAGVSLLTTPGRKVRVGVSENLFDVWNTTPGGTHSSRAVESAFLETELKLPWRMTLTERGVYYYSFSSSSDGRENSIELSKKFTETLSTAIRHEIRRDNPDGRSQDYTRLKLLFGLDF